MAGTGRPARVRPVAGTLVVLLVLAGVATQGAGGGVAVLGLVAVAVGLGALAVGRARWAFVPGRRTGAAVVAAGMALCLLGAGTAAPTPLAGSADDRAAAGTLAPAPTGADPEDGARSTDGASPEGEAAPTTALAALGTLEVKGRAPRTGYDRDLFGSGWVDTDRNGCDTRNDILARDLTGETFRPGTRDCVVLTGTLVDPYSGRTISFVRGQGTSEQVQIDHVVALSDAWQKGAQGWDTARRTEFANDPLNLLAVDGRLNQQKGDGDAATWLPPSRAYRCDYVARQIAVKARYGLWITQAERNAMETVLGSCPDQSLPDGAAISVEQPVPVPAPDVYFPSCAAARAAGAAPLHVGQPGYRLGLDRDGDGIACE